MSRTFASQDGATIWLHSWLPEDGGAVRGVVQIAHGMGEHAARYAPFATFLTGAGYAVYANDHRGHGMTAGAAGHRGHFADADGWRLALEDMRRVAAIIAADHPALPLFLFGHSMGSFLARSFILRYGAPLQGVVLSGTGGDPGLLGWLGLALARGEIRVRGARAASGLLTKLSFAGFNAPFRPNRTPFDWLSRDDGEVDRYLADPFCGGYFTAAFFRDLFSGIREVSRPIAVGDVPAGLPILLLSGERDPVGNGTRGVRQVADAYRRAGVRDVTCRFYPDGRHEMLNELNRDEVHRDIAGWLDARS